LNFQKVTINEVNLTQYLTHHWPISNCNMSDIIGFKDMTQGVNSSFTKDRYGRNNSALALNGGWAQVPSGVYFDSPEFSISVWVNPLLVDSYARAVDFGQNNGMLFNIFLSLNNGSFNVPNANIVYGESKGIPLFKTNQRLVTSTWQLVVVTFNGSLLDLYINESLTARMLINFSLPFLKSFENCFIGKSNTIGDGFSYSYLDDLRFYNKSLSQDEILYLLQENETCNIFGII
jgi:hypothetical protein